MAKKQIYYVKKSTSANTTYATIQQMDKITIMSTLLQLLCIISEGDNTTDKEMKENIAQCHTKTSALPKSRSGQNSIVSYLGGMINNIKFGSQRDYTLKQLDAIDYITKHLSKVWTTIPHLEFIDNDLNDEDDDENDNL